MEVQIKNLATLGCYFVKVEDTLKLFSSSFSAKKSGKDDFVFLCLFALRISSSSTNFKPVQFLPLLWLS